MPPKTTPEPPSPDYGRPEIKGSEIREPTANARQGVTEHNVRYILAVSTGVAIVALGLILLIFLT